MSFNRSDLSYGAEGQDIGKSIVRGLIAVKGRVGFVAEVLKVKK